MRIVGETFFKITGNDREAFRGIRTDSSSDKISSGRSMQYLDILFLFSSSCYFGCLPPKVSKLPIITLSVSNGRII